MEKYTPEQRTPDKNDGQGAKFKVIDGVQIPQAKVLPNTSDRSHNVTSHPRSGIRIVDGVRVPIVPTHIFPSSPNVELTPAKTAGRNPDRAGVTDESREKKKTEEEVQREENEKREREAADEQAMREKLERKARELYDRQRDEREAKRLVENPDLEKAVERLREPILAVRRYLDDSYHNERAARADDRLIMKKEFVADLDVLNAAIKDARDSEKLTFNAKDVWAKINGMPLAPDIIHLRVGGSTQDLKLLSKYSSDVDAFAINSPHHPILKISAIGASLEKCSDEAAEYVDTSVFLASRKNSSIVREQGRDDLESGRLRTMLIGMTKAKSASDEGVDYNAVAQRFREYGFTVDTFMPADKNFAMITIDLHSAGYNPDGEKFLKLFVEDPTRKPRMRLTVHR